MRRWTWFNTHMWHTKVTRLEPNRAGDLARAPACSDVAVPCLSQFVSESNFIRAHAVLLVKDHKVLAHARVFRDDLLGVHAVLIVTVRRVLARTRVFKDDLLGVHAVLIITVRHVLAHTRVIMNDLLRAHAVLVILLETVILIEVHRLASGDLHARFSCLGAGRRQRSLGRS